MSIKKALKTVAEVEQWGKDSAAYQEEQRVKRGEVPPPRQQAKTTDQQEGETP